MDYPHPLINAFGHGVQCEGERRKRKQYEHCSVEAVSCTSVRWVLSCVAHTVWMQALLPALAQCLRLESLPQVRIT